MLSIRETIILFATITLLIFLLIFIIPSKDVTTINIISIISAFVTTIGFYITLKQLRSVRAIAYQIDDAVSKKLTDFNKLLLLSDVSNKIALIHEIKAHLRDDQLEICIVRMEDLKRVITTLTPYASLLSIEIDEERLREIVKNFNIDMHTIDKKLIDSSYKIRLEKIIQNMDHMSTYLLQLEIKLKQLNHE